MPLRGRSNSVPPTIPSLSFIYAGIFNKRSMLPFDPSSRWGGTVPPDLEDLANLNVSVFLVELVIVGEPYN